MAWRRKLLVILVCMSGVLIVILQLQLRPRAGQLRAHTDKRMDGLIRDKLSPAHWERIQHVPTLHEHSDLYPPNIPVSSYHVKSTNDHVATTFHHVTRIETTLALLRNVTNATHPVEHTRYDYLYKTRDSEKEGKPTRNLNYHVIKKNPPDGKSSAANAEAAYFHHDDSTEFQPISDEYPTNFPSLVLDDHDARIQHLQQICSENSTFSDVHVNKGNLTDFYYTREYNFAYCKVPKSASTFWMRMFMVLWKGDAYSRFMTRWTRADIHNRSKRLTVSPTRVLQSKTRVVVVSRNPYSRLLSAYVDKVYLPLFWEKAAHMEGAKRLEPFTVNVTVRKYLEGSRIMRVVNSRSKLHTKVFNSSKIETLKIVPICANDVSFEKFLKFIISEVEAKRALEPHWAPITFLCRPCLFNTYKVVKQETFAGDVDHVLDAVGIQNAQFPSIKTMLHDRGATATSVTSIIGVVAKKSAQLSVRSCLSVKDIAKRLWTSFQIQGYISDTIPFPDSQITKDPALIKYQFQDLVLKAISQKSLSPSEKETQRHDHLVDAYRGVGADTIKAIQHIYKPDFLLFDYPFDPPAPDFRGH